MTNEEETEDNPSSDLVIPLFLQRVRTQEGEGDSSTEAPTPEQMIEVIRKLIVKRDAINAKIEALKKQAEGMIKRL